MSHTDLLDASKTVAEFRNFFALDATVFQNPRLADYWSHAGRKPAGPPASRLGVPSAIGRRSLERRAKKAAPESVAAGRSVERCLRIFPLVAKRLAGQDWLHSQDSCTLLRWLSSDTWAHCPAVGAPVFFRDPDLYRCIVDDGAADGMRRSHSGIGVQSQFTACHWYS